MLTPNACSIHFIIRSVNNGFPSPIQTLWTEPMSYTVSKHSFDRGCKKYCSSDGLEPSKHIPTLGKPAMPPKTAGCRSHGSTRVFIQIGCRNPDKQKSCCSSEFSHFTTPPTLSLVQSKQAVVIPGKLLFITYAPLVYMWLTVLNGY